MRSSLRSSLKALEASLKALEASLKDLSLWGPRVGL